ncbi:MAG: (4Fe-4S)-binding protein [Gemmatimonadota bacterium]|nr:(4Fe-4S)-binding protein [Gemmatimonadota bacterium]
MPQRLQVYETPEIAVTFDPAKCKHTGICLRGLSAVFDVRRKRWVRPEAASAEEVAAQVARCPSGALQAYGPGEFEREEEGKA